MPIDPFSEELLTFSQAARRLPRLRNDRPVSPATIWRWATVGLRGVKLETTKVGSVNCTSLEALRRFLAHLNGQAEPPAPTKQRSDSEDDVAQKLTARGYPHS